jgi:hypothetical protein
MTSITVMLEFTNEWGEEDTLTFELPVSRVPRMGETMDFEGAPDSGLELSMTVTEVNESFYLTVSQGAYMPAERTEVVAHVCGVSDKPYGRDDLKALFHFYGGVIQGR